VVIQGAAQVAHDALPDLVVEIALADPDQAGDDRDGDHEQDEEVEQAPVEMPDGDVDEQLEQDRVDDAQAAGQQDRAEDDQDLEPVGDEEDDDLPRGDIAPLARHRGLFPARG
jgi:hypothetical protein